MHSDVNARRRILRPARLARFASLALAAGLLLLPFAVDAQLAGTVPRVGIVWVTGPPAIDENHNAFLQGLREVGYVDGQNIRIEARFARGEVERLPELFAELVRLKVAVIVAPSTTLVQAARQATTTIPIVMTNVADPVGMGFVASLARPGGNITGLTNFLIELVAKNLELLKQTMPRVTRVAILVNPDVPYAEAILKEAQVTAGVLGLKLHVLRARKPGELEGAIIEAARQRAGALLVSTGEGVFFLHRKLIVDLAIKHRLAPFFAASPPIYVAAGALMTYGTDSLDLFRQAGVFVDKLLKGAKPADLPVEQPTKIDLMINLRTAKALGLTIPPAVLGRANEVIE